jgi:cytidylate kinase
MKIPKQGRVIAIDGPAASGKTTVTRLLAKRLNFNYVDTGALYRAIAFLLEKEHIDQESSQFVERAEKIAHTTHFEFKGDHLFANSQDITHFLRTPAVSMLASHVSAIAGVRASLLGLQRRLGCQGNSILEGRDIGTVIFPDADLKVYLYASLDHRSERRFLQMQPQDQGVKLQEIVDQLSQRDHQDQSRTAAPLKQAADAIKIDTSELSLEQVVNHLEDLARNTLLL